MFKQTVSVLLFCLVAIAHLQLIQLPVEQHAKCYDASPSFPHLSTSYPHLFYADHANFVFYLNGTSSNVDVTIELTYAMGTKYTMLVNQVPITVYYEMEIPTEDLHDFKYESTQSSEDSTGDTIHLHHVKAGHAILVAIKLDPPTGTGTILVRACGMQEREFTALYIKLAVPCGILLCMVVTLLVCTMCYKPKTLLYKNFAYEQQL